MKPSNLPSWLELIVALPARTACCNSRRYKLSRLTTTEGTSRGGEDAGLCFGEGTIFVSAGQANCPVYRLATLGEGPRRSKPQECQTAERGSFRAFQAGERSRVSHQRRCAYSNYTCCNERSENSVLTFRIASKRRESRHRRSYRRAWHVRHDRTATIAQLEPVIFAVNSSGVDLYELENAAG